jgi:hypothetical protein
MADNAVKENYDSAVSAQRNFEAYAVALTFTILGLSVQTGHFGVSLAANGLEVMSWLGLLLSGLVGLRRMERTPQIIDWSAQLGGLEARVRSLVEAKEVQGVRVVQVSDQGRRPIDEEIKATKDSVEKLRAHIKPQDASMVRLYKWQRGLFVWGLISLLAARAYFPVAGMVIAILHALRH